MGWSPGLNPPKSSQKTLTINTTVSTSSQDTSQLLGNFSQALSTVKLTVPTKISVKLQVGKCSHLPSIHWKPQNTMPETVVVACSIAATHLESSPHATHCQMKTYEPGLEGGATFHGLSVSQNPVTSVPLLTMRASQRSQPCC